MLHLVVYSVNQKGRSEATVLEDIAINEAEKRTGKKRGRKKLFNLNGQTEGGDQDVPSPLIWEGAHFQSPSVLGLPDPMLSSWSQGSQQEAPSRVSCVDSLSLSPSVC